MPSTLRISTAHAARTLSLFSLFTSVLIGHARAAIQQPKRAELATAKGCYSDATPLEDGGTWTYQSQGYCGDQCRAEKMPVMGLSNGNECWCGDQIPADDAKVEVSNCNSPCTGYGSDDCGGDGYWSVFLTGIDSDVPVYGGGSSSSSTKGSSTSSGSATSDIVMTSVAPGGTVVVTISAGGQSTSSSSASEGSGSGGSNTAGIAAGAVVGVVALAGIIGGLFFWIRHKKKKEAEEDYKQRTQVSDFMRGANERKPPSTAYSHMSDQRLDPETGRRNSVGSLADANDYSRRILRVANPDSS